MNRFVDMHCHILPGVDDGAQNPEETQAMLTQAWEEGIRIVVATPHYHKKRGKNDIALIERQLLVTRKLAKEVNPDMQVCLGMEIYYGEDIPALLGEGKVLSLRKSRYVLLEFSPEESFDDLMNAVRTVQMSGYNVVIAHIERYECLRSDLLKISYLHEMGACMQVNTGSIIGNYGRNVKKFLREALKSQLIQIVGTDAHDTKQRSPRMKAAYAEVVKQCGEIYADCIFEKNAKRILLNKEIEEW